MSVLFVTGASCAGKTTVGEAIAKIGADNVTVRDLDEDAPARASTAWLDWLRWRAAEELEAGRKEPDVTRVVTGIVWPARLIESPAWRPAMADDTLVRFYLLNPSWRVMRRRLDERTAIMSKADRTELRRYNRELRTSLRLQVSAMREGVVLPRGCCPADLAQRVLA